MEGAQSEGGRGLKSSKRVEPTTLEELERRIRNNILRLLLQGDEIPLKHFAQLKEDLETWERYRAAGLLPTPEAEAVELALMGQQAEHVRAKPD